MSDENSVFGNNPSGGSSVFGGNADENGSAGHDANRSTSSAKFSFIDPATIGNDGSGGTSDGNVAGEPVRKRRGRKPGSTNSAKAQTLSLEGVASILVSSHLMLAALVKTPELEMSEDEANKIAAATANVARHYDVKVATKSVDWANLIFALGAVYGPRVIAIRMRKAMEKPKPKPVATGVGMPPEFVPMGNL